jgi:hypothetical protein
VIDNCCSNLLSTHFSGINIANDALDLELFFANSSFMECFRSYLVPVIYSKLCPATTGTSQAVRFSSLRRTNRTTGDFSHPLIQELETTLSLLYASLGYSNVQFYEAGVYKAGEYFSKHYDYLSDNPALRARTILLYSGENPIGGELVFPLVDVSISPLSGLIVSWSNISKSRELSFTSLHESKLLVSGTKMVLTFFASL